MELVYWVRYMAQIILDGDAQNEWLLKMPPEISDCIETVGEYIGWLLGY